MMEEEDLENELSSDDEDYKPEAAADSVSENSGPDEEYPENSDNEDGPTKTKKRKKAPKRSRQMRSKAEEVEKEEEPVRESEMSKEEMKKRADELWADFLGDTEQPPPEPATRPATSSVVSTAKPVQATPAPKPTIPAPVKIFEFAGETVEIPTKPAQPAATSALPKTPVAGVKRPSGGGLASMLEQLNKKNKLSVLEKTKLDWDGFKSNEGISEELQTHNRGRDGFLERRDFLERTDLRQFEIEKNLRMTRRK